MFGTETLNQYIAETIMSFSGWRRVFADDRQEDSRSTAIHELDYYFLCTVATVLASDFVKPKTRFLIARDSRPTGSIMEQVLVNRVKDELKEDVKNFELLTMIGVITLPQALALVKEQDEMGGLIYLTASHNPVGHNGIKLGDSFGQVISSDFNAQLVRKVKKLFLDQANQRSYQEKSLESNQSPVHIAEDYLKLSFEAYENLIEKVMGDTGSTPVRQLLAGNIQSTGKKYRVVVDYNGSSRSCSYDQRFFDQLGVELIKLNQEVGIFNHGMTPEGSALNQIKEKMLEVLRALNSSGNSEDIVLFGYAVDCDGDRGNLIFPHDGKVMVPDAQTTFALTVLSELIYFDVFHPEVLSLTKIVVNGPTSLRIEWLADIFRVGVERVEVGEINLVTKARELRDQGFQVKVVGEGSNGGSIVYPSTVRDPLTSIASILKLVFLENEGMSLGEIALEKLGLLQKEVMEIGRENCLVKLVEAVNSFFSTDLSDPIAKVKLSSNDQVALKRNYEDLWVRYFDEHRAKLTEELGINDYQFVNYEGTKSLVGQGNREEGSGGLKVRLLDEVGKEVGFLWFRGSKTEPLLRISSEFITQEGQQQLFNLQAELLLKADRAVLLTG